MISEPQILAGKVIIVTGVTSGLGTSLARVLAARGATVIGTGRRAEKGQNIANQVCEAGYSMEFLASDMGKVKDCERVVETVMERFGCIDGLVNNAGVVGDRPAVPSHELTEADWDYIVDINLKGAFFMCSAALRHMRAQQSGSIVNIASINAVIGMANMAAYNSAKAGVVQMTRTLAVENIMENINVNTIILGGVVSEASQATVRAYGKLIHGEAWEPTRETADEVGMDPEQVARAISLLLTDDARLISGGAIPIDNGMSSGLLASTFIYLEAAELIQAL